MIDFGNCDRYHTENKNVNEKLFTSVLQNCYFENVTKILENTPVLNEVLFIKLLSANK